MHMLQVPLLQIQVLMSRYTYLNVNVGNLKFKVRIDGNGPPLSIIHLITIYTTTPRAITRVMTAAVNQAIFLVSSTNEKT